MNDPKTAELMAALCQHAGVACPGPGAGLQVAAVIGSIDQSIEKLATLPQGAAAVAALELYRDALHFVAGVWAFQQGHVIAQLEAALKPYMVGADAKSAEGA